MDTMKQTGIQWIGEIPSDWNTKRIKYMANLKGRIGWQGLTSDEYQDDGAYLITGVDFADGGIDWENCVHVPMKRWEEARDIQIQNGDLLITKDGTIGKVAIVSDMPGETSLNSGVLRIMPIEGYSRRFLYWVIKSDEFWNWFNFRNSGNSTIIHLYQGDFAEFLYAFPNYKEQEAIADFLDEHCGKLDSIVSDLEKQIETLQKYKKSLITETLTKGLNNNVTMKDSGIEWIGKIPEHWELNKIRYVTTLRTEKGYFDHCKDVFVGLENIESSTGKYVETESEYEDGTYDIFIAGDVMFGKLRPYLSKTLMPDFSGFCTGELCVIKKSTLNMKYLFYYMFHDGYLKMVNSSTYGTKMPRASWDYIKNLSIPIPPESEQKSIIKYLDKKCVQLESLLQSKQTQVLKMKSHRNALIFEYITGKKRVKEVQ